VSGAIARTAAAFVGVNKSTAAYYFLRLRLIITQALAEGCLLLGPLKGMKVILGAAAKGSGLGGAAGKAPVLGILKRGRRV